MRAVVPVLVLSTFKSPSRLLSLGKQLSAPSSSFGESRFDTYITRLTSMNTHLACISGELLRPHMGSMHMHLLSLPLQCI